MTQFEIEVVNSLRVLLVSAHLRGYGFIKTAMNKLHEDPELQFNITKGLYAEVAEHHNTTPSRVERGIRHALETCYSDYLIQKKVLGTGRELTNGEFLATLNEAIKIKMVTNKEAKE